MPNVGSGSSVVQEEEEELSAAFGADLKHVFALRIHAMSDDWRSWLELRLCLFRSCLWGLTWLRLCDASTSGEKGEASDASTRILLSKWTS